MYSYGTGCPCGKPSLVTTTGMPATIYQYNEVNDIIRTGTSGDDLTLTLASGTDRITDTGLGVVNAAGKLWLVQSSAIYPTAGSGVAKTVNTSRTLLAGFTGNQVAASESVDIAGNVARSTSELERASHVRTTRSTVPGVGDDAVSLSCAGRAVSAHQPGSNGNVTFAYDDLGRQISVQQPGHAHAETTTGDGLHL